MSIEEQSKSTSPGRIERKLAAILSADVKGYSRLMGEDEVATIRMLSAYREVMPTLIRQYRGRVVDAPGDPLLAEFASVVDAVQCAVATQRALKARNATLLPERKMACRIGITLGEVIVEGERIYGDGVNIAARVEGLAEPGGIAISGTVYDQVKNKLALAYEPLGEHVVKNIREPVRVYRVLPELEPAGTRPEIGKAVGRRRWRRAMLLLGVVLLAVAGGVAVWSLAFRSRSPGFGLTDKPSVAVLPFENMSGDTDRKSVV